MTFFSHCTMRLYHAHVSTKFEANRSKNMVINICVEEWEVDAPVESSDEEANPGQCGAPEDGSVRSSDVYEIASRNCSGV